MQVKETLLTAWTLPRFLSLKILVRERAMITAEISDWSVTTREDQPRPMVSMSQRMTALRNWQCAARQPHLCEEAPVRFRLAERVSGWWRRPLSSRRRLCRD